MKRNLTIQLDQATIKEAKIVAAKRSMSVSGLVSEEIHKAAIRESAYEKTKNAAITRLMKGYDLGNSQLPKRHEIYDR